MFRQIIPPVLPATKAEAKLKTAAAREWDMIPILFCF